MLKPQLNCVMNKNDTIVADMVIQALKMDDTIKRQEVIIERLTSDKNELLKIVAKLKNILAEYVPDSIQTLELLNI